MRIGIEINMRIAVGPTATNPLGKWRLLQCGTVQSKTKNKHTKKLKLSCHDCA